jgi:hypothetical protein
MDLNAHLKNSSLTLRVNEKKLKKNLETSKNGR